MDFPKNLPGEDFINSWYPILIALVCGLIYGVRNYFKGPQCDPKDRCSGKTVIVTGGNSGIGKEIAVELAGRGGKVIIACRDEGKGAEAAEEIKLVSRSKKISVQKLDMASFKSIKDFAAKVNQEEEKVDILFNNAGVICHPQEKTTDGNEYQFQVNYLGHFLLTHLLMDKLKASEQARIINNTALAYKLGEIDLDDLNWEKKEYKASEAYSQSKLALVYFTQRLAKELEGTKITVNVCLPGVVNTDGLRHMPFKQNAFIKFAFAPIIWFLMKTAKDGAQTATYAAVSPEEDGVSGKVFSDNQMVETDKVVQNEEIDEKLWELSKSMTGIHQYV